MQQKGLKELIEFLNSEEKKSLVTSAIETLYREGNDQDRLKIAKLDKFFDI